MSSGAPPPSGRGAESAVGERTLAALRAAIGTVYRDTARPAREIHPAALLGPDLGLDSLDLAQVVVLLERDLGVDPFRDPRGDRPALRTVDDLSRLYASALSRPAGGDSL